MINNLKTIRKQHNIHQKDLATAIGVSPKIVYKWENGTATPSIRAVLLLSHFLNTPIDHLFSLEDEIE
jgi:DNA-binding XRE family transcriptional regulator